MSADVESRSVEAGSGAPAGRLRTWAVVVVGAVIFVVAGALRLVRAASAYEINIDETEYQSIVHSMADGRGLKLFGQPFLLHPPGLFVVGTWYFRLTNAPVAGPDAVLALRPVDAVAGALGCVAVAAIVLLLARTLWPAALAGAVAALDPFSVRWDSRFLLEAPAMMFSLVALAMVLLAVRARVPSRQMTWGVLAGVTAGLSILFKDTYFFTSGLPLLVLLVAGRPLPRRVTFAALACMSVVYSIYPIYIVQKGLFSDFVASKTLGVSRVVGTTQLSGFNASGSQGLHTRVGENLSSLVTTLGVLVVGAVAIAYICYTALRRLWPALLPMRKPEALLAITFSVCVCVYVGYSMAFGTLEEQTFYPLVKICIVMAATGAVYAVRARIWPRVVAASVAVLLVLSCGWQWLDIHRKHDDGYRQLQDWITGHVPAGATVAIGDEGASFLLQGITFVSVNTMNDVYATKAEYALTSTVLVSRGYGTISPALLTDLKRTSSVAFQTRTTTLGTLTLFAVDQSPQG